MFKQTFKLTAKVASITSRTVRKLTAKQFRSFQVFLLYSLIRILYAPTESFENSFSNVPLEYRLAFLSGQTTGHCILHATMLENPLLAGTHERWKFIFTVGLHF